MHGVLPILTLLGIQFPEVLQNLLSWNQGSVAESMSVQASTGRKRKPGKQVSASPPGSVSRHLAGQSAAGVHARFHEDGWCDGPTAPARGTTGQPFRRRSPP